MEMTNAQIQREIKDIETYLERAERDIHLYEKSFIEHKKMKLAELKREAEQFKK